VDFINDEKFNYYFLLPQALINYFPSQYEQPVTVALVAAPPFGE
jgi:hypothetical protein